MEAERLPSVWKTTDIVHESNLVTKKELALTRIRLISALRTVMKNGFALIGVPYLESM